MASSGNDEMPHGGGPSDPHSMEAAINELRVGISTLSALRKVDLKLSERRHTAVLTRLDTLEGVLASKADLFTQVADLRQRVNDIQAMEASLREASLQTIRSTFQAEANVVEQKISLGSQQRYTALEGKQASLEGRIDKAELGLLAKISESKSSVEAQIGSLESQIKILEASLDGKIKGQVVQGIVWGMGLIGAMVGLVTAVMTFSGIVGG